MTHAFADISGLAAKAGKNIILQLWVLPDGKHQQSPLPVESCGNAPKLVWLLSLVLQSRLTGPAMRLTVMADPYWLVIEDAKVHAND